MSQPFLPPVFSRMAACAFFEGGIRASASLIFARFSGLAKNAANALALSMLLLSALTESVCGFAA